MYIFNNPWNLILHQQVCERRTFIAFCHEHEWKFFILFNCYATALFEYLGGIEAFNILDVIQQKITLNSAKCEL